MTTVSIHPHLNFSGERFGIVGVRAYGGSPHSRGSAIGALARRYGLRRIDPKGKSYRTILETEIRYQDDNRVFAKLGCWDCVGSSMRSTIRPSHIPGYGIVVYWDNEGPYECMVRCYTCNHRDR